MQKVSCYLCKSDAAVDLFQVTANDHYLNLIDPTLNNQPLLWKACCSCGFIYRSPMLTVGEEKILYSKYGDDVFKRETPDAYFDRISTIPDEQSENYLKSVWLLEQLGILDEQSSYTKSHDILDVGCGSGLLMHKLSGMLPGATFYGVEPNADYAGLAERRTGARVLKEEYRGGLFGRRFDLVMCTKVLEHMRDPAIFLRQFSVDVAKNGSLFIEVPDASEVERLSSTHDRFLCPHHYFYSRNTLSVLLANQGFMIVTSRSVITPSGRCYLQLLARPDDKPEKLHPPFDSAEAILAKRLQMFPA